MVTRAAPQAASLIEAIQAHGGTPIALPLLKIVEAEDGGASLSAAISELGSNDWLVVLSPNGARRVVAHSANLPSSNRPHLAVIASGTEKVFTDAGFATDLIPEVASSVGLLAAFESIELDGRVLIAQAENLSLIHI